jgi:hypothetical protein
VETRKSVHDTVKITGESPAEWIEAVLPDCAPHAIRRHCRSPLGRVRHQPALGRLDPQM